MPLIVHHPELIHHLTGVAHPERPERTSGIIEALTKQKIMHETNSLLASSAPLSEILRCHTPAYVELVKEECAVLSSFPRNTLQLSTGDAQICSRSYELALTAAGSGLVALNAIMKGINKTAFCVVRPPGHHATSHQGMGFCLFNNAAICARYAQKRYGFQRILIADWDVHHGNGTQEIFSNDPTVYYFSTHQEGIYPGTGFVEETGVGNITNVPIKGGKNSRLEVLSAYQQTLPLLMEKFQPQLVIISAGFDAHREDPLGGLDVNTEDFQTLTLEIKKIADGYAEGRIISFLEGGYNLKALAASACAHAQSLGS